MNSLDLFGPLLGRILIALIYLISGYRMMAGFKNTAGEIASKGLPWSRYVAVGAIVVELCGGTMVLVGWNARWAAGVLIGFTALAGLLFHNFWAAPARELPNQMTHFLKNICILGGLVYVVIHGSGPFSIERG